MQVVSKLKNKQVAIMTDYVSWLQKLLGRQKGSRMSFLVWLQE